MQIEAAALRTVMWQIDYSGEPEVCVCLHVLTLTVYGRV